MKKRVLLSATLLTVTLLAGCGVKQTASTVTVEAGQELNLKATDFLNIKEEEAGDVTFDVSNVKVDKVGKYKATATYKKKVYTIEVTVADTTAPKVTFKERYAFTNDIAAYDATQLLDKVEDASEYKAAFTRFEKAGTLDVMDAAALTKLTDEIVIPGDQKALAELGTEEVPTEEGIYRAVLAVTDDSKNTQLEEVYIILDKTGALIEDVADKTVEQEDVTAEPEVNLDEYHITDNVDGEIADDEFNCQLKLTDEDKHQYTVYVSYIDRAGNESKAEFLIKVVEKKQEIAGNGNGGSSAGNGNGGNSGGTQTTAQQQAPAPEPTPAPTTTLTPAQQAVVNVGYYNIVSIENGFAVMVHGGEYEYGSQLLRNYLASIGCGASAGGGGWINESNDQFICHVTGIYQIEPSEW